MAAEWLGIIEVFDYSIVYLPEWSESSIVASFACQRACEFYSGWTWNLDRAAWPDYAAQLTREFMEHIAFPADQFPEPELTRESVAAAFRRGLELVAEIRVPCPDPADESLAGKREREAWCKVIAREVAKIEAESRVPLAGPRDPEA